MELVWNNRWFYSTYWLKLKLQMQTHSFFLHFSNNPHMHESAGQVHTSHKLIWSLQHRPTWFFPKSVFFRTFSKTVHLRVKGKRKKLLNFKNYNFYRERYPESTSCHNRKLPFPFIQRLILSYSSVTESANNIFRLPLCSHWWYNFRPPTCWRSTFKICNPKKG